MPPLHLFCRTCFVAPGTSRTRRPWSLMQRCFFFFFFFCACRLAVLVWTNNVHGAAPWIVHADCTCLSRSSSCLLPRYVKRPFKQEHVGMLPPEKKIMQKKKKKAAQYRFFSLLPRVVAFLLFSTCIIHHGGCSIIAPVTACTATHPREVGSSPSSETLTANIETCLWSVVARRDGLSLLARADLLSVLV